MWETLIRVLCKSPLRLHGGRKIGLPEAAIPLAQATIYVASSPKSNAGYLALSRAQKAVRDQLPAKVPQHLRSTALHGSREAYGNGEGYQYPHDFPGHFVEQYYLPEGFQKKSTFSQTAWATKKILNSVCASGIKKINRRK